MDQAAAERKLQEAVGFTYYPVGSNENWRDSAVSRLWNHAVSLQSQLSASEERVRALTELLRQSIAYFNGYVQDEAVEEEICVDHEHHVAAQKFKQALKEAESLLPSPPQVESKEAK